MGKDKDNFTPVTTSEELLSELHTTIDTQAQELAELKGKLAVYEKAASDAFVELVMADSIDKPLSGHTLLAFEILDTLGFDPIEISKRKALDTTRRGEEGS